MFTNFIKSLSILKKFLFINLIFFSVIGLFTFLYIKNVQPNLIKKKSSNHIEVINNTIDNLTRLEVKFVEEDIRKFLFSTRFLFQSLDRVIFFDNELNLVGDTDTLDLDPRSFSKTLRSRFCVTISTIPTLFMHFPPRVCSVLPDESGQ